MLLRLNYLHKPTPLKRYLYLLVTLFVFGCGPVGSKNDTAQSNESSSPNTTDQQVQENLKIPPALLSNSNDSNSNDGLSGLKGMSGMKGIKIEELFTRDVKDDTKRIDRLENIVTNLYSEIVDIKPAIIRLVSIEKDMQELIKMMGEQSTVPDSAPELTSLENDAPINEEVPSLDTVISETSENETPKIQEADADTIDNNVALNTQPKEEQDDNQSLASLEKIRVADHPNHSRIVLEFSQETPFDVVLDQQKNTLSINLSQVTLNEIEKIKDIDSVLLSKYSIESSSNGTQVKFDLKGTGLVHIIREMKYRDENTNVYKLVIDVSHTENK